MSKTLDKVARELMRPMNKRDVFLLNTYTTLWGIWVANPFWDTFTRGRIYSSLSYIFPEWVWGSAALLIGILSVAAVVNDRLTCLKLLSKAGTVLWLVIAILYLSVDYTSTAWITAFVIASFYFLKAINLSINKCQAFNQ